MVNTVCGMAEPGSRGETIYCAILIAQYNGGGGAMDLVLHAKNSTDQSTTPE